MTVRNYFELLHLSESVDDSKVIREAEAPALQYWQMMLTSATGNKLWEVREILSNNLVAEAVRVLSNDTLRQEHRQRLQYERAKPELPDGQVQVGFDLPEKGRDLSFKVIENPIMSPLKLGGYTVNSPQELVYRLWLNPELYTTYLQGNQVALWLHYAGAETHLADWLTYIDWRYGYNRVEDVYHFTLDLLQACYPIPDLPRSAPYIFDKLHQVPASELRPYPAVLYLGMIPNEVRRYKIVLRRWRDFSDIAEVKATSPYLKLDLTNLNNDTIGVIIEGNAIQRGVVLNDEITLTTHKGNTVNVTVLGARYKMFDNQELEQQVEIEYAKQLLENQALGAATERFYRTGALSQAKVVAMQYLQWLYDHHRWPLAIEEAKRFIHRFGDSAQVSQAYTILVEASRYMAGTLMTLELKQRAHPYLVNLAIGSSKLEGNTLSNDNWSMRPDAQITLNPVDARHDWIEAAEAQNMRWTQPGGNAGKTHFVGDRVITLKDRYIAWRQTGIDYPVIASHGVLVARTFRRDGIVGLDAASGELRWFHHAKANNGRTPLPEPVILDKRVFWCDLDGTLFGLDLETGKEVWSKTVENPVQLTLLAENNEVYLATGNKILIFVADDGELIFESNELRTGMFGLGIFKSDDNPFNLILSDKWLGFQNSRNKATIANMEQGNTITSHMPGTPLPWCVHEGVFFQAWVVAYYGRYQTSDGTREHRWEQLFIEAFHASDRSGNSFEFLLSGTAYKKSSFEGENSAYTETYTPIKAISLAPVTIAGNVLTHHTDRKNPHQLIAVAYEKRIIYLTYEKNHFKARGDRKLDSVVQALMYSNVYDIAVTRRHISTSFVGQTDEHTSQFKLGYDSTLADSNTVWLRMFSDQQKVQLEGTPAIYGDMIYLTHNNGELIALAP